AVLQVHGTEGRWSEQEIHDLAVHPCVAAVSICLPVRVAPDQRNFDPLWEALQATGLPVLHRPTFCAQVWSPARLLTYLRLTGVFERFPGLRFAFRGADGAADPAVLAGARDGETAGRVFAIASDGGPAPDPQAAEAGGLLWASDFPLGRALPDAVAHAEAVIGADRLRTVAANAGRFLAGRVLS
ncbi:MAG: Amidohydrolase, partial [Solirubrobacteraceae bacterium]|nr:Amidohydrolase [Solirubrobacteraceae bacterium]